MNVRKQTSKMNVRVIGNQKMEVRNHLFGQRNGRSKISDLQRHQIALFVKNFIKSGKSINKACKVLAERLPIGVKQIYNIYRRFKEAVNKNVFVWEKAIVGIKDVVVKSAIKKTAVKNVVKKTIKKTVDNKSRAGVKKSAVVNKTSAINLKGKGKLASTNRKIAHKTAGNSPYFNTTPDLLKINWRDFSVRPQDYYGNLFELDKQFIKKINDKRIIKLEERYIYLKLLTGMIGNLRNDLAADLKYLAIFNKTFYKETMKSLFGTNKVNELETKFDNLDNFDSLMASESLPADNDSLPADNVFASYVSFFVSKYDIKDLISSYKDILSAGKPKTDLDKRVLLEIKVKFHKVLFAIENKDFLCERYLEQTKKLLRNRKKFRMISIPKAV